MHQIPLTLTNRLKEGKVIPFVGAGVSMSVLSSESGLPLFPSWPSLLKLAALRLDNEGKHIYGTLVRSLLEIDKPDVHQAAKYAKDSLGPVWFDFLKQVFDPPRAMVVDESLELAKEIWKLGSKLVITTNYERCLRWACPNQNDIRQWSIAAPVEQAAALRQGVQRELVWHLHGDIDDCVNLILTPSGYERLYHSPKSESLYASAIATLQTLLVTHSFIFIGFSLNDEALLLQLKSISEVFGGSLGPHYALIHEKEIEKVKGYNLPGVEILSFTDYGEPLVKLVKDLTASAQNYSEEEPKEVEVAVTRSPEEVDEIYYSAISDTPPPTTSWVGRTEELEVLNNTDARVVAITGIGGQGKSTLAAKFLAGTKGEDFLRIWCDCKEQGNTIRSHITKLIEQITGGKTRAVEFATADTTSIIKVFMNLILSVKGVFVFDNVDQYIDVYQTKAVDALKILIELAMKNGGECRFIFTTRPKLNYDHSSFLHLELSGLSIEESKEFFEVRGLLISSFELNAAHELTQGHPLWMGMIAMQVVTNRVSLADLISRIKAGKKAGIPNAMLEEIWRSLRDKHQVLLRYLAEMVKPETEAQLEKFVSKNLNFNQFNKALRQLKALDLVVVKSPLNAPDTLELHPLLREFVRTQFSQSERNPYISAIIIFIDQVIDKIRPTASGGPAQRLLETWCAKVELLINSGDYKKAIAALDQTRRNLIRIGQTEDFVRLAVSVYSKIDLEEMLGDDTGPCENCFLDLVESLAQMGRFDDAEEYISRFEELASGATARYVAVCQMRTHLYWSKKEFDLAKEWGKRGVEIKSAGNLDTRHDCLHDLALARRDSGEVNEAIAHFWGAATKADVLNPAILDSSRAGAFYGNIGRSLFLLNQFEDSEVCLLKSAWLLEKSKEEIMINLGWIAFWLAELYHKKDINLAYIFYRRAVMKWKTVSPPRMEEARSQIGLIMGGVRQDLIEAEDWRIDGKYLEWMNKSKRF